MDRIKAAFAASGAGGLFAIHLMKSKMLCADHTAERKTLRKDTASDGFKRAGSLIVYEVSGNKAPCAGKEDISCRKRGWRIRKICIIIGTPYESCRVRKG